ncbi:MAG: CCA tRNA nucleotidyltransferase [Lachnospiraceae bacterium]|nr:CCA tRNA nucleotidyltransferase [Lachnospiraceae bacterium]
MDIKVPDKVKFILKTLNEEGYEAFIVGGCVRDMYRNTLPKDWDITTSAKPLEVKKLFKKTLDTGLQHGTVTVMLDGEGFEVTTYRLDGDYSDHRHPEEVTFTSDLVEDLKRRDFTINAMAYNETTGVVDCFNGLEDLKNGIIRCVGNPEDRFEEDALRMLRAIRFASQFDFVIEENTYKAIKRKAPNLQYISAERIKVEFDKILLSKHPKKLIDAYESGITKVVLPEFDEMMITRQENPNHIYNVGPHTICAIESLDYVLDNSDKIFDKDDILYNIKANEKDRLILKWTLLLHDVAKPLCKTMDDNNIAHFKMHDVVGCKKADEILQRLKSDNYTRNLAILLIKYHDYRFTNKMIPLRRALSKIGTDNIKYLFIIKICDVMAQNPDTHKEKFEDLRVSREKMKIIIDKADCLTVKSLNIKGNDIMNISGKNGREIGECLKFLLEKVIDNPEDNNYDKLEELTREYFKL